MGNAKSRDSDRLYSERERQAQTQSTRPSRGLTYASQRNGGSDDFEDNPYKRMKSRDQILKQMIKTPAQITRCRRW